MIYENIDELPGVGVGYEKRGRKTKYSEEAESCRISPDKWIEIDTFDDLKKAKNCCYAIEYGNYASFKCKYVYDNDILHQRHKTEQFEATVRKISDDEYMVFALYHALPYPKEGISSKVVSGVER